MSESPPAEAMGMGAVILLLLLATAIVLPLFIAAGSAAGIRPSSSTTMRGDIAAHAPTLLGISPPALTRDAAAGREAGGCDGAAGSWAHRQTIRY
eukprot:SAG25_NODE_7_length_29214_cov_40.245818_2_plen_95_part_00